uniref:Uncharacterized protein n=1 Tax=Plectus sambesii TaxID=2011161 RepID=A0A914UK17_9BILA
MVIMEAAAEEIIKLITLVNSTETSTDELKPYVRQTTEANRSEIYVSVRKSSAYFQAALQSIEGIQKVLIAEKMRYNGAQARALRILAREQTAMTVNEKIEMRLNEDQTKIEEAYDMAKSMYREAIIKLNAEQTICKLTLLSFICRWLGYYKNRVILAEKFLVESQKMVVSMLKPMEVADLQIYREMIVDPSVIRREINEYSEKVADLEHKLTRIEPQMKFLQHVVLSLNYLFRQPNYEKGHGKQTFEGVIYLIRDYFHRFISRRHERPALQPYQQIADLQDLQIEYASGQWKLLKGELDFDFMLFDDSLTLGQPPADDFSCAACMMMIVKVGILLTVCCLPTFAYGTLITVVEESENALINVIEKDETAKTKEAVSLAASEFLHFMTVLSAVTTKQKARPHLRFRSLITEKSVDAEAKHLNDAMVQSADFFRTALDSTHDTENILMIEQIKASSGHQRALRLLAIQQSEEMTRRQKDESVLTELIQKAEELYERAKTIHSDAASKLYYEKNRCELTALPFICKHLDMYQNRMTAAEELRKAARMQFDEQKKEAEIERDLTINLQIRLEISTNKYQAAAVLKQLEDLTNQAKPLRELVTAFDELFDERMYSDIEKQTGKGILTRITLLVRDVVKNFLGTSSEPWKNLEYLSNEAFGENK